MPAGTDEELFIGMISGTSRDGIDAVIVDLADQAPKLVETLCLPYPPGIAGELDRMVSTGKRPGDRAMQNLDLRLAEVFAQAVKLLLQRAEVDRGRITAIGSHGQTVWHDPDALPPETIQLGQAQRLADLTRITTVGDFRQADLLAGGQGAPLAPLLHRELFQPAAGLRAIVNLGGIANTSLVASDGSVTGFDTGPANCLMDAWIKRCRGLPYDEDGQWAASGTVSTALLQFMLKDDYFHKAAPKSTGIEYFNVQWLDHYLDQEASTAKRLAPADVQATLCELTARTVADSLQHDELQDVLICGGGSHNSFLLKRIQSFLDCPVNSTSSQGLDPDWVEAVLFAWLARDCLLAKTQETQAITGAVHPVLLGQIFNPTN